MSIIICPGIHDQKLTESFISGFLELVSEQANQSPYVNILVYPAEGSLALSGFHIWQFVRQNLGNRLESPVIFISFSAGVIGALGAAYLWQLQGGRVKAFIAIDGWGVPLVGDIPFHRMSHDYFSHWSSCLFGGGQNHFYADPPVEHLSMWREPQTVEGWCVNSSNEAHPTQRLTAADFLLMLLQHYEQN